MYDFMRLFVNWGALKATFWAEICFKNVALYFLLLSTYLGACECPKQYQYCKHCEKHLHVILKYVL